ncbi:MAG: hypothetical protein HQL32_07380 [Planctomycetes bacterium]|nr:hypothetical protein [Planctomycetota bacterium]
MAETKEQYNTRFFAILCLFFAFGILITCRLFQLQILNHQDNTEKLDRKLTQVTRSLSGRGSIISKDGQVLAQDTPCFQLAVTLKDLYLEIGIIEELDYYLNYKSYRYKKLRAQGLQKPSKEELVTKIKNLGARLEKEALINDLSHYCSVNRTQIINEIKKCMLNCMKEWAYLSTQQITNIYLDEGGAFRIMQNPDRYAGFSCQQSSIRHYPQKEIASHIVGYMGQLNSRDYNVLRIMGYYPKKEGSIKPIILNPAEIKNLSWVRNFQVGKSGTEYILNNTLRGQLSEHRIIKGSDNPDGYRYQAKDGKDVPLSIDVSLQKVTREAFGSHIGSAVLLDLDTGDVLCSVSLPSYDPNILTPPTSINFNTYANTNPGVFLNRCLANHYPFGSVFKIITAVAGLEENIITPHSTYHCQKVHGRTKLKCLGYHTDIDVQTALMKSCNIYFYETALNLGIVKLHNWAKRFHLGQSLGTGFPYERNGVIPSRLYKMRVNRLGEPWYPGDTCHTAIGQGYQLGTPLQAAVVTGLLSRPQGIIRPHYWPVKNRDRLTLDIKEINRETVKTGLWRVVNHPKGTAYRSRSEVLEYAGKTGTADVYKKEPHAWFAGFAPFHEPKVAVAVIVENGGHGGDEAAPIAKLLLEAWHKKYVEVAP